MVLGVGLVLVAVLVVAFAVASGSNGGSRLTTDVVTRLAARDAGVGDLIDEPLLDAASQMGIERVPKSVTLAVTGLEVTPTEAGEADLVDAVWTLTASGPHGVLAEVDQSLSARIASVDGRQVLADVVITPALAFDCEGYFEEGTSAADAQAIAADLRDGISWLPGTSVSIEPDEMETTAEVIQTPDPDHLVDWSVQTQAPEPGVQTTWSVRLAIDDETVDTVVAATAVTRQPVAEVVSVGTLTPDDVARQVATAAHAFTAAILNDQPLQPLMTDGSPIITDSGREAMKEQLPTVMEVNEYSLDTTRDQLAAWAGDLTLTRADGSWLVDGAQSHLITRFIDGAGSHAYNDVADWIDFTCGVDEKATIKTSLLGVAVYSDGAAAAEFKIASRGDVGCDDQEELGDITATWPGNRDGIGLDSSEGSKPGQAVVRMVALPEAWTPDLVPLTIRVGIHGGDDANAWVFTAGTE